MYTQTLQMTEYTYMIKTDLVSTRTILVDSSMSLFDARMVLMYAKVFLFHTKNLFKEQT